MSDPIGHVDCVKGGRGLLIPGRPTKGYKQGTLCVLVRKPRSKWWTLVCLGQKGHYHKDGTCEHTDEIIARLNPEKLPIERLKVIGWGQQ
jgi:hypothetical protein